MEVLFRGFHPCNNGEKTIFIHGEKVKGRWVFGFLTSKRTINEETPMGNIDEIVVIPETVGQYTTIDDKNGKKLFDGDLVESSVHKWKVVIVNGMSLLCDKRGHITALTTYWVNVSKIGTIYDSPELLEDRND